MDSDELKAWAICFAVGLAILGIIFVAVLGVPIVPFLVAAVGFIAAFVIIGALVMLLFG